MEPNNDRGDGSTDTMASLEQRAVEARQAGDFDRAARLFALAATSADQLQRQLHLQIRQACCLLAIERYSEAAALATVVAQQARAESYLPELADALAVVVDHYTRDDRLAEAAHILSEAAYILDRLPNDAGNYQVMHNMAVTYAQCGFVEAALELYDRALRLAEHDEDRQFAYASICAAYHYAAQRDPNPDERNRLLHDGLYAATAALDPEGGGEVLAMCPALAHRSMMLAEIGHYHAALDDARNARHLAIEHGMREEQVIAMTGEAMALWGSSQNTDVLDLIRNTPRSQPRSTTPTTSTRCSGWRWRCCGRWSGSTRREPHSNATCATPTVGCYDERAARWEHVRLGVEHLRVEALSESDPLTGLPNRRHLAHLLARGARRPCSGVRGRDRPRRVQARQRRVRVPAGRQRAAGSGRLLERVCRRGDSVVRLGGDEFVMVLRETSPGDARSCSSACGN
jgi:tetratricopeptide (TPR) repeat protein